MALTPIQKPVRTKQVQSARESGATKGQIAGAVGGGLLGAFFGPGGAVAGAQAGAGLGMGIGGAVGQQVQPAQQQVVTQEQLATVPTHRMSQGAQQLLDGIRALDNYPALAEKYTQPLTQAYIQSQMELKRRS